MPNQVLAGLERGRHFNCSFGEVRFDLALEIFLQVGLGGRGDKEAGGGKGEGTKTLRQEAQGMKAQEMEKPEVAEVRGGESWVSER